MTPGEGDAVTQVIERYTPRGTSAAAARFAKEVTAAAGPTSPTRAKALLYAACRLGAFGEQVGLDLSPEVLLCPSVIERVCHPTTTAMSAPTRRTLRSNLRAIARAVSPGPPAVALARERAKAPYTQAEIACYLALADAQGTEARRQHASALVCLGAGAGLVGTDLKGVRGTDVVARSGGVVVDVRQGRCARVVPVLARYRERLLRAAGLAGERLLIGGTSPQRRNVTTPLTSALCGGSDLPRLDICRLRATWLVEVAATIGLRAFMDAAGIVCSQRLGDLVGHLEPADEVAHSGESGHLFRAWAQGVTATSLDQEVSDEHGPRIPELVRRAPFAAPPSADPARQTPASADPAKEMATALVRAYDEGVPPGDVLCDCGYSNRDPDTFAAPLRQRGAGLVMDLHPSDRGQKSTYKGAILANGNLYCPCTPTALLALGPLGRGATDEQTDAHDAKSAELARYKLGRVSKDDQDGQHRVMCPAAMGKIRCPLLPESMARPYTRPEVLSVPEHPPACCTHKTITVEAPVNAKTAQKHDYPSKAHRLSFNRRTGAERTFGWLKDPATTGITRGWCRLTGRTKNALMFTLAVVVRNVRLVETFERDQAAAARRAAMGLEPLRRRRRHRDTGPAPSEPEPTKEPAAPG